MRLGLAHRVLVARHRRPGRRPGHYFTSASLTCDGAGTIAVTIVAGPLNYVGANPKLTCG
jgi:hypothetical protein